MVVGLSDINRKYNTYDLSGDYGIGYTTKGEEFYFDLEDYDLIKDYCWRKNQDGYIITLINANGKRKTLFMHNVVMNNNDKKLFIDHKNHCTFDNRKSKLRYCEHYQNCINRDMSGLGSNEVIGVTFCKNINKWRARIGYKGKRISLGLFQNFDDAVKARKEAEQKYFGEYIYGGNNEINE